MEKHMNETKSANNLPYYKTDTIVRDIFTVP